MSLRVCFVALNAYPAIDPRVPGVFGGIETRSWMFARALEQFPEFEVSFVVRHWQPQRKPHYDNVRLILQRDRLFRVRDSIVSRWQRTNSFPGVRVLHPRWSDALFLPLLAARKLLFGKRDPLEPGHELMSVEADLFLTFGVQSHSATVIASAHAAQRPAVLFLGSDSDLDERYRSQGDFVSVYRDPARICLWVIEKADRILCQTESQVDLLRTRFGREGTLLRNPIDLDDWERLSRNSPDSAITGGLERYALWIGRADPEHKRPQLLLEVAGRTPEIPYLMIMNRRDDVVDAEVRARAPANVRIVERVPFEKMPAIVRQAGVVVNTSSLEGFSNVFLQAAASGVPIASLAVPLGFPAADDTGFCAAGNLQALVEFIRRSWNAKHIFKTAAREYIGEHHSLTAQARALANILQNAASQRNVP